MSVFHFHTVIIEVRCKEGKATWGSHKDATSPSILINLNKLKQGESRLQTGTDTHCCNILSVMCTALFLLLYQCISVAPLYHLQRCCLYTMWQTIENSIRALAEGAVICWSVARASELCCKVTAPPTHTSPAERESERDRHAAQCVASIWISIRFGCICLERGHISHQASIHFSCLLRGCSSRESAFLNVPASIRSCLCGAPAAGSALCSKRQRERENSIVGLLRATWSGEGVRAGASSHCAISISFSFSLL